MTPQEKDQGWHYQIPFFPNSSGSRQKKWDKHVFKVCVVELCQVVAVVVYSDRAPIKSVIKGTRQSWNASRLTFASYIRPKRLLCVLLPSHLLLSHSSYFIYLLAVTVSTTWPIKCIAQIKKGLKRFYWSSFGAAADSYAHSLWRGYVCILR